MLFITINFRTMDSLRSKCRILLYIVNIKNLVMTVVPVFSLLYFRDILVHRNRMRIILDIYGGLWII